MNEQGMAHLSGPSDGPAGRDGDAPLIDLGLTKSFHPNGVSRVLVLNLDRQQRRWERICEQASRLQVAQGGDLSELIERVSALDGRATALDHFSSEITRTYTLADFCAVDPQPELVNLANPEGIVISSSPQELAVAESHMQIWRRVAAADETVLVLEDDAEFEEDFGRNFDIAWDELAATAPRAMDILFVSYRPVDSGLIAEPHSERLVRPRSGLWWMSGYVISPRGAQRLLDALPLVGPVDQWLNHRFSGLDVYATSQPLIRQARHRQSDNQYSVIPVLRTARGASAGLMRKLEGPRAAPDMEEQASGPGRRPVFGLGLSKTGTTSLHKALEILGYTSCHWQSDEFSDRMNSIIDSGEELPFDAFTDVASVRERFQELDRRFPEAAFVLTVRDLDSWLASRTRHVAHNQSDVASGRGTYSWTSLDLDSWLIERLRHHEAVFSYFKSRPGKLLVLDICGGDEWYPLCNFLGCPVPSERFPHVDPLAGRTALELFDADAGVCPASGSELPHDDFPWIDRPLQRPKSPEASTAAALMGGREGQFLVVQKEEFQSLEGSRWAPLTDTFATNLAMFRPANVTVVDGEGVRLEVREEECSDRLYTAGGLATQSDRSQWHKFGRFEAELRPAVGDGLLTGLFLYRRDPWQEIDLEFLGRDTTKLLANVYFNPGEDGDLYNYGSKGTPILLDLGFDASAGYHRYAIEWDPSGIRWLVDDVVVYARSDHPTPVPHLPMRLYVTTWPIDAAELAGKVDAQQLPAATSVRSTSEAVFVPPVRRRSIDRGRVGPRANGEEWRNRC